jgi:hypothetical protein
MRRRKESQARPPSQSPSILVEPSMRPILIQQRDGENLVLQMVLGCYERL